MIKARRAAWTGMNGPDQSVDEQIELGRLKPADQAVTALRDVLVVILDHHITII
jgi:hypothetical protein